MSDEGLIFETSEDFFVGSKPCVLQMSGLGFDCLLDSRLLGCRSSQDVEVLPTFDASGDSQDMGGVWSRFLGF